MNTDLQGTTSGGGNFSQTRNPQTIGGQNLGNTTSNIQTQTSNLLNQNGLKIISVGSTKFEPVDLTTTQSVVQAAEPETSVAPFIIGLGLIVLAITLLVVLAVKNKKLPSNSQNS